MPDECWRLSVVVIFRFAGHDRSPFGANFWSAIVTGVPTAHPHYQPSALEIFLSLHGDELGNT